MNLKNIYLLVLLLYCINVKSQDFSNIDNIVKEYKNFNNLNELTNKISSDFNTDIDRTRAIFFWISTNISYDIELSKKIEDESLKAFSYKTEKEREQKEKKFISELSLKTFNSKSAVCFGYAALFYEICNKLGLECKLVEGDLKSDVSQINKNIQLNHAWNVVKVQNQWKLIDCTIAAGNISSKTNQFVFKLNDTFFFTEPKIFFLNHFPLEKKWLFINRTKEEYISLPVYLPDYFKSNIKVINPVLGFLSNNNNINLIVDNINTEDDIIKCYFNKTKEFVYLEHNIDSNSYEIPLKDRQDDYIIIYFNKTAVIVYKLQK